MGAGQGWSVHFWDTPWELFKFIMLLDAVIHHVAAQKALLCWGHWPHSKTGMCPCASARRQC